MTGTGLLLKLCQKYFKNNASYYVESEPHMSLGAKDNTKICIQTLAYNELTFYV